MYLYSLQIKGDSQKKKLFPTDKQFSLVNKPIIDGTLNRQETKKKCEVPKSF
jgi:hypothetical protein